MESANISKIDSYYYVRVKSHYRYITSSLQNAIAFCNREGFEYDVQDTSLMHNSVYVK